MTEEDYPHLPPRREPPRFIPGDEPATPHIHNYVEVTRLDDPSYELQTCVGAQTCPASLPLALERLLRLELRKI